jgi:hypothetical protein
LHARRRERDNFGAREAILSKLLLGSSLYKKPPRRRSWRLYWAEYDADKIPDDRRTAVRRFTVVAAQLRSITPPKKQAF